ncbi:hypothetical protein CHS0354_022656 [Potamilus streckersoni]|uniref:Prolyl 4-hydroxylase alpha subunit domain-containing protein n=1 Tax=Potamilus streckersoni TaxID=2493646 RepID=A0AAE0WD31_9BIVA|nr:hypothetical protein CHS0354_022656 [Potamilus streckersoni]
MKYFPIIFILFAGLKSAQQESYKSVMDIEQFIRLERTVIDKLETHFKRQEERGDVVREEIKQFLKEANISNSQANQTTGDVVGDPIGTFLYLRRAAEDWMTLKINLMCTGEDCPILSGADVIDAVLKREKVVWPSHEDLKDAAVAILQIWNLYELNIDDVMNGRIGSKVSRPLSPGDLFYICRVALDTAMPYEAIKCFEKLQAYLKNTDKEGVTVASVYRGLAGAYNLYGMSKRAVDVIEKYLKLDPENEGAKRDLEFFKLAANGYRGKPINDVTRYGMETDKRLIRNLSRFEQLCRRELTRTSKALAKLRCFLRPAKNSYDIVREEIINNQPRIILYHDVISAEEADGMIHKAQKDASRKDNRHRRETVGRDKTIACDGPKERLLNRMAFRITEQTGFGTDIRKQHNDCHTISEFYLGGTYLPETDYLNRPKTSLYQPGDNIVTWTYLLSDPEDGGLIVFPKLKLSIPCVKGSALLWWNLKLDGTSEPKSVHAHCPVIRGRKWIATKFMRANDQIIKRGCRDSDL